MSQTQDALAVSGRPYEVEIDLHRHLGCWNFTDTCMANTIKMLSFGDRGLDLTILIAKKPVFISWSPS